MSECPMCHYKWCKEKENYAKIRKEVIQEIIQFLEKQAGEKK